MTVRESRKRRTVGSVEQLVAGLVAGQTIEAAAEAAGMSEASAHRRLAEPEVRQRLDAARLAVVEAVSDRLSAAALGAVATLDAIASDTTVAAGVRVQAANGLLARVTALREASHVEARLTEIEAAIAAQRRWAS